MTGKAGIWRNALLLLFSTAAACTFPAYLFFILYNGTWQAVFSVWLVLASFGTLWMFPALWGYFYDRTQALIGAGGASYGKFLVLGLKAPFFNPFSYILVIFLHNIALFCFALGCLLVTAAIASLLYCFLLRVCGFPQTGPLVMRDAVENS